MLRTFFDNVIDGYPIVMLLYAHLGTYGSKRLTNGSVSTVKKNPVKVTQLFMII